MRLSLILSASVPPHSRLPRCFGIFVDDFWDGRRAPHGVIGFDPEMATHMQLPRCAQLAHADSALDGFTYSESRMPTALG